jgi:hypothetical protein
VTIHDDHPFMPEDAERSPARRFRSRLASPVTLWTAGDGESRAGLTVSSLLVADGDPGVVVGILDPLSDLWDALRDSGRAVVTILDWADRRLADAFGYVAPAPGGPFTLADWTDTEWGPRLSTIGTGGTGGTGGAGGTGGTAAAGSTGHTWAGCELIGTDHPVTGWGILVRLSVAHVDAAADSTQATDTAELAAAPLVHRRGRYSALR